MLKTLGFILILQSSLFCSFIEDAERSLGIWGSENHSIAFSNLAIFYETQKQNRILLHVRSTS